MNLELRKVAIKDIQIDGEWKLKMAVCMLIQRNWKNWFWKTAE